MSPIQSWVYVFEPYYTKSKKYFFANLSFVNESVKEKTTTQKKKKMQKWVFTRNHPTYIFPEPT